MCLNREAFRNHLASPSCDPPSKLLTHGMTVCRMSMFVIGRSAWGRSLLSLFCLVWVGGCSEPKVSAVVFYCDGAGWYSSASSVKSGLRAAGFKGRFDTFSWSAFLGPGHDHLVTARSKGVARRLSRKIERERTKNPRQQIYLMGLSAGTAIVLSALEQAKEGIDVDHVVLFSPSVSARRDLTPVMQHVRGQLYATSSPHDGILKTIVINADGGSGPPAGRSGFRMPPQPGEATKAAYRRVINLPWQPSYVGYDWDGGHTAVTRSKFVEAVIAPRILRLGPHPLDRSIMEQVAILGTGADS